MGLFLTPQRADAGVQAGEGIRISVVVPAYNRSQQLHRLLSALASQSLPACQFEVVICDDDSSEDLAPLLAEAVLQDGLQVAHARLARRQGPSVARNLGLSRARGEIVAFTDSDCVPDRDWLLALGLAFDDESVGLVGGRVDYREAEYLSARCVNFLMSSMLGAAGARDPRSPIHMEFYPRTGNLAVRRALAIAAGGFTDHPHGEDLEFSHRVRLQGPRVLFVPDSVVLHDEKRRPFAMLREAFLKGEARVRLARSCRMHQWIHALPAFLVVYLAAASTSAVLYPPALLWVASPGLLYLFVLMLLGIQGALALGEVQAGLAVPIYAAALHLAYGSGYIAARIGSINLRPAHLVPFCRARPNPDALGPRRLGP